MPRFFADETSVCGDKIIVSGSDARHIGYSLRMKIGDEIIFAREGLEYRCTIAEMTADSVRCSIIKTVPSDCEPSVSVTLYQALPKSDKMGMIIQKTTELGISRIVPFVSARCVSRPDAKSAEGKVRRWRKIAEEAAKQSGRGIIPEVAAVMSFEEALKDISADIRLICYENGGIRIAEAGIDSKKSVAVIIGAEGGFQRGETEKAAEYGAVPVWLGRRILRCETCPAAVTAVIMHISGNL